MSELCATDAAHYLRTWDYVVLPEGGAWRVGTALKSSEELIAQAARERRLACPPPAPEEPAEPPIEAPPRRRRRSAERDEAAIDAMPAGERRAILREVLAALEDLRRVVALLERP